MPLSRWRLAVQLLLVRLRFPLLLVGVLLLLAAWPTLSNYWDRLTRAAGGIDSSVSSDTEYWCPMCPGVLSEWPAKCPVCHMALVRRKKGEATPLPDGVVARMQLSPYRVQLAGIRTAPAEYRPLSWEVTLGCLLGGDPGHLSAGIDVPETEIAPLRRGMPAKIECEAFPGQAFGGTVRDLAPSVDPKTRSLRVVVEVEDPDGRLRPGLYVTVRLAVPLTQFDSASRFARDDWRDRTAGELAARSLAGILSPNLASLLEAAQRLALRDRGLTLAVLNSSVIDTGERKVVFVETMPGLFDGVEVTLGRRCGDYYPVLRGLEPGQAVVTAGAFLLDAETRLNPGLAAAYFGAKSSRTIDAGAAESATSEDEKLIAKQKVCPVMEEPLGSMGPPVRVVVEGRTVFLCCKGCEAALRREPKKFLAKLPAK